MSVSGSVGSLSCFTRAANDRLCPPTVLTLPPCLPTSLQHAWGSGGLTRQPLAWSGGLCSWPHGPELFSQASLHYIPFLLKPATFFAFSEDL